MADSYFEGSHEMADGEVFAEGEHSQAPGLVQRGVYSEVLRAHDDTDVLACTMGPVSDSSYHASTAKANTFSMTSRLRTRNDVYQQVMANTNSSGSAQLRYVTPLDLLKIEDEARAQASGDASKDPSTAPDVEEDGPVIGVVEPKVVDQYNH
jgi:hypothetical protein